MSSENTGQPSSAGHVPAVIFSSLFNARPQQKAAAINTSIFEKFGIMEVSPRDCDIIGLDIGTNEWSASMAQITSDEHCEIIDLCTTDIDGEWKDASVLFYNTSADSWTMGKAAVTTAMDTPGTLFDSYRVSPDSAYIEECHGFELNNPSRKILMQRLLQEIFRQLHSHIPLQDPAMDAGFSSRKAIILISLPSRPEWAHASLPFRDLIAETLEATKYSYESVQIAVVPEVQATLASLLYQNPQAEFDRCTVTIDVGAACVDAIVVKKGKISGTYSRKLGASSIEDNLLEMALHDASTESANTSRWAKLLLDDDMAHQIQENRDEIYSRLETMPFFVVDTPKGFQLSQFEKYCSCLGISPSLIKLRLRYLKEQFFKTVNSDSSSKFEASTLELGEGLQITVDSTSIRKALYQMPVFVPSDDADGNRLPFRQAMIYRSYYDALSHFMVGLRNQYLKTEFSPQVILTGGASVMPLVSALVKKHLRVEPIHSLHPELTVSRGLAFIGYKEALKLDKLRGIGNDVFDFQTSKKGMLLSSIKSNLAKSLAKEELDEIFRWVEDDTKTSPQSFLLLPFQLKCGNYNEQKTTAWWWDVFIKDYAIEKVRIQFDKSIERPAPTFFFQLPNDLIERLQRGQTILAHQAALSIEFDSDAIFGKRMAGKLADGRSTAAKDDRMRFYLRAKSRRVQIESFLENHPTIVDFVSNYTNHIVSLLQEDFMKSVSSYAESLTPYSL